MENPQIETIKPRAKRGPVPAYGARETVTVRLPVPLMDKLRSESKARGVSLTQVMILILLECFGEGK